jgi:hypothetical protein
MSTEGRRRFCVVSVSAYSLLPCLFIPFFVFFSLHFCSNPRNASQSNTAVFRIATYLPKVSKERKCEANVLHCRRFPLSLLLPLPLPAVFAYSDTDCSLSTRSRSRGFLERRTPVTQPFPCFPPVFSYFSHACQRAPSPSAELARRESLCRAAALFKGPAASRMTAEKDSGSNGNRTNSCVRTVLQRDNGLARQHPLPAVLSVPVRRRETLHQHILSRKKREEESNCDAPTQPQEARPQSREARSSRLLGGRRGYPALLRRSRRRERRVLRGEGEEKMWVER